MLRLPQRSPSAPVMGADAAEEYVRKPRNRPASVLLPPRDKMWNGAVGNSWKADRNTMKLYVHRVKKRGVNSLSRRSSRAEADSACDVEDEFANVSTGFHQAMRLGCLAERKRF